MTLLRAIHERLSGYRPLTDLAPPDRVYTGLPPLRDAAGRTIAMPYVSVSTQQTSLAARTSSGTRLGNEVVALRCTRRVTNKLVRSLRRSRISFSAPSSTGRGVECSTVGRASESKLKTSKTAFGRSLKTFNFYSPISPEAH